MEIASQQFQLRIVEGTVGVTGANERFTNVGWEGMSPNDRAGLSDSAAVKFTITFQDCNFDCPWGSSRMWYPDAAGANARGVMCSGEAGRRGDEFIQARGSVFKVVVKPPKVIKSIVKGAGESQSRTLPCTESRLEVTEQTACPRDGKCHRPQFAK